MGYRIVTIEDLPVIREFMHEYERESETYRSHRVNIEGFVSNLARSLTVGESLVAIVHEEKDGRLSQLAVMNESFYFGDLSKLSLTVLGAYTREGCTGNFYRFLSEYAEGECIDYIITGYRADEPRPHVHNRMLTRQGYEPLTHSYIKEVTWQQQS